MEQLTAHPGRILIFLAVPPVGLGPRASVPWTQENVVYFVQSPERRSYIGAYPPPKASPREHCGKEVATDRANGGGGELSTVEVVLSMSHMVEIEELHVESGGSARRFGSQTPCG